MHLRRHRVRVALGSLSVAAVTATALLTAPMVAEAAGPSAKFSLVGPASVVAGTTFVESAHTLLVGDTTNAVEADLGYPSPGTAFLGADGTGSQLTSVFLNGGGNGQTLFVSGIFGGNDPTGDILISNNRFRAPCTAGVVKIAFLTSSGVAGDMTGTDLNSTYPVKKITVKAAPAGSICVSASTAGQGTLSRSVTVTGANLVAGTTIDFGSGVTVKKLVVKSSSKMTATIAVSSSASVGDRNVTVTRPSGAPSSCTSCFTITPAPAPTSVEQATVGHGTTVATSVDGSNFISGAAVKISGSGVTTTTTGGIPIRIDLTITATAGATRSTRNVTVTNPDGGVGVCVGCLTIS